jgi:hypothetical protein
LYLLFSFQATSFDGTPVNQDTLSYADDGSVSSYPRLQSLAWWRGLKGGQHGTWLLRVLPFSPQSKVQPGPAQQVFGTCDFNGL